MSVIWLDNILIIQNDKLGLISGMQVPNLMNKSIDPQKFTQYYLFPEYSNQKIIQFLFFRKIQLNDGIKEQGLILRS